MRLMGGTDLLCSAQQWQMCLALLMGSGMRKEQDREGGQGTSSTLVR